MNGDISKITNEAEDRMKKAVSAVAAEFMTVRTGRASAAILDRITVDYYGTQSPLKAVANIMVPEPQLIVIQPWDKSVIPNVEKAILQSDLGLTPSNDGTVIRLPFPPLTEERRKDIVKIVKKYAEGGRVAIRNIRRDANDHLKQAEKNKEISEDDLKRAQDNVQELTDKYINEIDEMLSTKENEVMEV